jgi:hypothetical protein
MHVQQNIIHPQISNAIIEFSIHNSFPVLMIYPKLPTNISTFIGAWGGVVVKALRY